MLLDSISQQLKAPCGTDRIVVWFSCGAASAVAAKLVSEVIPPRRLEIVYCEVKEEHNDNSRFLSDVEKWIGRKIKVLGNDKYKRSVHEVIRQTKYLKGPSGARCTGELKKYVRERYSKPNDLNVFGYDASETNRINLFIDANNEVEIWPVLHELGIEKNTCFEILAEAGIELPVMYRLGYGNNNCIGCVKGEAGYWNKIRIDFPEVYERMARLEELTGRTVCKSEGRKNGKRWLKRITLRELKPGQGRYDPGHALECGPFCQAQADLFDNDGAI